LVAVFNSRTGDDFNAGFFSAHTAFDTDCLPEIDLWNLAAERHIVDLDIHILGITGVSKSGPHFRFTEKGG
jgi:hypothetical protein